MIWLDVARFRGTDRIAAVALLGVEFAGLGDRSAVETRLIADGWSSTEVAWFTSHFTRWADDIMVRNGSSIVSVWRRDSADGTYELAAVCRKERPGCRR